MCKPFCYIYLIHCSGTSFFKIGIARSVESRLDTLQPACPFELVLVNHVRYPSRSQAILSEMALHEKYAHNLVHGEWFSFQHDELEDVKAEMLT